MGQYGLASTIAVVDEAIAASIGRHSRWYAQAVFTQPLTRGAGHVGWQARCDANAVLTLPLAEPAARGWRVVGCCLAPAAATKREHGEHDGDRTHENIIRASKGVGSVVLALNMRFAFT